MAKIALIFLVALAAHAQTTTISDTLTAAVGGGNWTGRITVSLNAPGSAQPLYSGTTSLAGWSATYCVGITGGDCTATTAAGAFSATLYTNDAITPAGTSYSARYQPTRGPQWSETWTVSAGDTKLYQIRATTVPTPTTTFTAGQVSLTANRVPYGSSAGVLTSESTLTHTPIPASAVAGNAFSRFAITGATEPSGEYYDENYTADLAVRRAITAPSHTQDSGESSIITGQLIRAEFNPAASWDNSPTLQAGASGTTVSASYPSGASNSIYTLTSGIFETFNRGSGAINTQRGLYAASNVFGSGNVTLLNDGATINAFNSGTGTVANTRGIAVLAGPTTTSPGTTTSLSVIRGIAYTYDDITTAYAVRTTRLGSVNPGTAWGISEETGWPSRFNGRVLVNKTTDDGTNALQVSGRIQATPETPASSSATCTAGAIVWDADYIYVCTSTNNWKRATLGAF